MSELTERDKMHNRLWNLVDDEVSLEDAPGWIVRAKETMREVRKMLNSSMEPKTDGVGVYAGSFDPITHGHMDIIKRATGIFGRVVIAIPTNINKSPWFSVKERMEMIQSVCQAEKIAERVSIEECDGLLVDFAAKKNAAIIRGIRAVTDFNAEFTLSGTNQMLDSRVETVFLMSRPQYQFVSSSTVREIAYHGGSLRQFVHESIADKVESCAKLRLMSDRRQRR